MTLAGIAVNIASRVSNLASSGEVLVSSTVEAISLRAGTDLQRSLASYAIKGLEEELRFFRCTITSERSASGVKMRNNSPDKIDVFRLFH